MPIYEYECTKCGSFEARQSMSDPVLKRCPTCKGKVTKVISAAGFQLKGGGWYADGYTGKKSSGGSSEGSSGSSD